MEPPSLSSFNRRSLRLLSDSSLGSARRCTSSPASKQTFFTITKRFLLTSTTSKQVKGMAKNKGLVLGPSQERDDADELRMAVKEIICDSDEGRLRHEEALVAITVEESLKRYCQRIERSDFWGGESELLVLSKLCRQSIIVYIPEHEHTRGTRGNGFIPIAEYGSEFTKKPKKGKQRMPVRLLYSGKNHYDLLV